MNERTCVFCGGKDSKKNLLRWVMFRDKLLPDWTQKTEGRSVYTHFDKKCLCGIYGSKKVFPQFGVQNGSFGIPETEILDFVKKQAEKSVSYYIALCRKSRVLLKGQNLISEEADQKTVFSALFFANDASVKTIAELEKKTGLKGTPTNFSKRELGKKFDGREVAVFVLKPSQQSEKLMFYMNLLNNFTSGDI
ncbi:YlxR family protein [bacterium]|nr:YlxR family protein [bacterium]